MADECGSAIVVRRGSIGGRAPMNGAIVELVPDRIRTMLLLNVVCFGAWDDFLHGHVLSALNSSTGPGFHLDKRPAGLEPGMLEREALVTYVPAHGGRLKEDGTSALWGKDVVGAFSEFGIIGGRAVVLDACDTASDGWLTTAVTDSDPSASLCSASRFWAVQGISPSRRNLTENGSWENS
jgi:hypothetical protein